MRLRRVNWYYQNAGAAVRKGSGFCAVWAQNVSRSKKGAHGFLVISRTNDYQRTCGYRIYAIIGRCPRRSQK